MSEDVWLFARRNSDGSVSIDIPKDWPVEVKANFEAALDLFIQRGKELEQERIIALLQKDICPDYTLDCCDGWCGAYVGAIKLIEAEQDDR